MASSPEELIIHRYYFGNQFGTFDEDRFKDESVDEAKDESVDEASTVKEEASVSSLFESSELCCLLINDHQLI